MAGLLNPPRRRAVGLLDIAAQAAAESWPGRLIGGLLAPVKFTGDVLAGRADPYSNEGIERAFDMATMAATGGIPNAVRAARAAPVVMESRLAPLYNPPPKPYRPFEADYPGGAVADEAGRLQFDIEGRPLVAERVAGRNRIGGVDEAVSPTQYDALSEGTIGTRPQAVASREMGGNAGRLVRSVNPETGLVEYNLFVDRNLPPAKQVKTVAHELGHTIDELAGQISTKGLDTELRQVFNTLLSGQERTRNLTGPQHIGYRGEDIQRELMAEAIRAYIAEPNYLKTVAPKTAAKIRAAVNSNPRLARVIQFNSLAGLGLVPQLIDPGTGRPET